MSFYQKLVFKILIETSGQLYATVKCFQIDNFFKQPHRASALADQVFPLAVFSIIWYMFMKRNQFQFLLSVHFGKYSPERTQECILLFNFLHVDS